MSSLCLVILTFKYQMKVDSSFSKNQSLVAIWFLSRSNFHKLLIKNIIQLLLKIKFNEKFTWLPESVTENQVCVRSKATP